MKYISLKLPDAEGNPKDILGPSGIPTGGLESSGTNLIQLIISLLFTFGIILTLISIIYSGIQMIMSTGEKQKLQNSRNRLMYSIIGFIVILLAFLIRNIIVQLLVSDNANLFLNQ